MFQFPKVFKGFGRKLYISCFPITGPGGPDRRFLKKLEPHSPMSNEFYVAQKRSTEIPKLSKLWNIYWELRILTSYVLIGRESFNPLPTKYILQSRKYA